MINRIIHMCKIISAVSLFLALLLLLFLPESGSVYATEAGSVGWVKRSEPIGYTSSCTARCHVNYMAYENKFEVSHVAEVFRHKTHSFEQDMECISCHDNSEVNTEGHGKLTIGKENCLKCHHVELKESECKRCHQGIDENPMKYKE